jgi:cell division septal protein FtsQ
MAFLDVISPDAPSRGAVLQIVRLVDRLGTPNALVIRWMLRTVTFVLMLAATFVGVQLAMNAPTVSPVSVSSQQIEPDAST